MVALMFWGALARAQETADRDKVLVLHSAHKNDWTDALLRGMESVLTDRARADIWVEYMDTYRADSAAYLDKLESIYRIKYAGTRFDVIITTGNNAFHFALDRQATLFANAPLVFCALNRFYDRMLRPAANATGIVQTNAFEETLRFAFRVRPDAEAVYIISDTTTRGLINRQDFGRTFAVNWPGKRAIYIDDVSLEALAERLAAVPEGSLVFLISFWRDADGRQVTPDELGKALRKSAAPVFGVAEWMVGRGLVGGKCVLGHEQGAAAARFAVKILKGTRPSALLVDRDSRSRFLFDYAQLTAHDIRPETLPRGSEIINSPRRFYQVPKPVAVLSVVSLVLLIGLVGALVVDVRQRKRVGAALRESEEWLRAILDMVPVGVVLTDEKTRSIDYANPEAAAMIGSPVNDIVGTPEADFIRETPEPAPEGGPRTTAPESFLRTSSGDEVPVHKTVTRARLQERDKFLVAFADISERQRMEEETHQRRDQYWHAEKMGAVAQLIGGIAHDLNNVLQAIRGYNELALQRLGNEHALSGKLRQTLRATERAADLVTKLQGFSRHMPVVKRPVNLNEIIENVRGTLQRIAGPHIDITVQPDPALRTVSADAVQIEQMLVHLTRNAVDAMPDGGAITIKTFNAPGTADPGAGDAAQDRPDHICLEFSDTGVGIPQEDLARVAEPFFTTKQGAGPGLGLATVNAIATLHRGDTDIDSTAGEGTTVRIRLPVDTDAEAVPGRVEEPITPDHTGTILLADDEHLVRDAAAAILQEAGYTVLTAKDGDEALAVFNAHKDAIDLLLFDVVMPNRSGAEVYRAVHKEAPDIPALFSSAHDYDVRKEVGRDVPLVTKPYRAAELLRAVKEAMRRGGTS
jgi:PAS domain S-box-containing protein